MKSGPRSFRSHPGSYLSELFESFTTMRAPSPVQIGDYAVIRTLGTGSTGKVKLARHPYTNKLVALKIIRKDLLERKRNLFQKVHREIAVSKLVAGGCIAAEKRMAELAANLPEPPPQTHIGVMKLLDVYDTENSFVLVLEHCDGGELFDILMRWGRLPEEQVLDVFQQLVYALEFCHRRGICHRDLKPENVLLTSDGRVKLADFGMASLHRPGSLLETSCGSPQYCAPEVILGEPYAGCAADVWSLGVVLYAMTTGGLPFDDDNLHRLISKINSGAFYMPEEVPPDLAQVMYSMLTVDTTKRATLEDIKRSDWFCSRPSRTDIYKEDDFDVLDTMPGPSNEPIMNPDAAILRYLRDLGLGDDPTIRYRLGSESNCVERDLYHQLLFLCGDSLSFRNVSDFPISPRRHQPENLKGVVLQTSRRDIAQAAILDDGVVKEPPPDAVQSSWLEHIASVLVSNEPAQPVTPRARIPNHRVSSASALPHVAALHGVTSV